jgi:hypothetical protein
MFKAGRAVGKGVRYLTQLGSKIGKGLGSSVDKLGAGTRNAQASVIKGARGARDAANTAGSAARRGVADARRGYNVGRQDLVNGDIMPKKSTGGKKLPSLGEWMNTKGKGMIRNPGTMPGNKPTMGVSPKNYDSWAKKNPGIKAGADKMRGNKDIYGKPTKTPKGDNYKIGRRVSDDEFVKSQAQPGMSKNRRAGIITGAAIGAGYGLHRANNAVQNHYQRQKNSSR